jgi:hypothetical protein
MSVYTAKESSLVAIADKIREKNNTTNELIFPDDFISGIEKLATQTVTLTVSGAITSAIPIYAVLIVEGKAVSGEITDVGNYEVLKNSLISVNRVRYEYTVMDTSTGSTIDSELGNESYEYVLDRNITLDIKETRPYIDVTDIQPYTTSDVDMKPVFLCKLFGEMTYTAWIGIFKHGLGLVDGAINCWGYVATGRHVATELDSNYIPVQGYYFLINDTLFDDGVPKFESGQMYDVMLFADQGYENLVATTTIQTW